MKNHLFSTTSIIIENRLVVIGGNPTYSRYSNVVAVIHEKKKLRCKVDSFPHDVNDHSATIIPTGILVCGGDYYLSIIGKTNRCYEYMRKTSSWQSFPSMTTARSCFDMKFLNQNIWAIGGFWSKNGLDAGSTMDRFDFRTKVWTKHNIPINIRDHCIAKISHDKLIVIGGTLFGQVSEEMR